MQFKAHHKIILLGIVILFLPILPAIFIGYPLGVIANCESDGQAVFNCVLFGEDISNFLNVLNFIPWLGLYTFPISIIVMLIGLTSKFKSKKG